MQFDGVMVDIVTIIAPYFLWALFIDGILMALLTPKYQQYLSKILTNLNRNIRGLLKRPYPVHHD